MAVYFTALYFFFCGFINNSSRLLRFALLFSSAFFCWIARVLSKLAKCLGLDVPLSSTNGKKEACTLYWFYLAMIIIHSHLGICFIMALVSFAMKP